MNRRGFIATVLGAITAGLARPWWTPRERVYSSSELSLFNADGTLSDEGFDRVRTAPQWAELVDRIEAVSDGRLFVVSGDSGYWINADGTVTPL